MWPLRGDRDVHSQGLNPPRRGIQRGRSDKYSLRCVNSDLSVTLLGDAGVTLKLRPISLLTLSLLTLLESNFPGNPN